MLAPSPKEFSLHSDCCMNHATQIASRALFVKTRIICNPAAGSVDDRDSIREKLERFPSATVHFTEEEGDATRLAQEAIADNCEIVIAAGGDGTLNEVINGVAPHAERVQVGLVPLGTGNDFARMLDLPPQSTSASRSCAPAMRAPRIWCG